MPEYLAPGVYVEEVEIGGKPIEGVSTSTAGFVGETERGPVGAHLVTGVEQYRRLFGAAAWRLADQTTESAATLPYAIDGFFLNGGKRCFVARVVGAGATAAAADLSLPVEVPPGDQRQTAAPKNDEPPLPGPPMPPPVQQGNQGRTAAVRVTALGPGAWGNRIRVSAALSSLGDKAPGRFRLAVTYADPAERNALEEVFDDLSLQADSPAFCERRVNGASSLVKVEVTSPVPPRARLTLPAPNAPRPGEASPPPVTATLKEGRDGAGQLTLNDYTGEGGRPGSRVGLAALAAVDEISMLCAPDEQRVEGLAPELVAHCERLQDRFAIINGRFEDLSDVGKLQPSHFAAGQSRTIDSKYAAFYAPHIKIVDGNGRVRTIPPGGHVAGVYARTDIERGVWKAPANEVVRGAVGLDPEYSNGDQEILNPRGVNCIRTLPGRGIRVWGARTTSSDPLWRYVNVRRLFLFIEESIDQGTQWVVFEPNDQRLWARVRQTASDFLTSVWRSGALMGATAEEAFFVKCDETTMTQNDLMTGRLVVLIGVAPVRPAEFVIFRIAQWTRGSNDAG
jgi:hypothetical protein